MDNLNRDLDRARGKRDSLASEVTILTAQIAAIEARLSEEKARQERDRVLGEIEAIKQRLKQSISAFAPVVAELCEATKMAEAVVPEARELNSFLLSVANEVDSVADPLLNEMDQCAAAVRAGHATLELPRSADAAPIEPPKNNSDWLLRVRSSVDVMSVSVPLSGLFPGWLFRNKEAEKKETAENPFTARG